MMVKSLNVGESVEKNKDNHDLGWESVLTADEGVNRAYFYAVVTIPHDFSQKGHQTRNLSKKLYDTTPAKLHQFADVSNRAAAAVLNFRCSNHPGVR